MSLLALFLLVVLLLWLRQPLLVILIAAIAVVHLAWGRGELDYIVEDMWVSLDKELILAIPMFLLCGGVMTQGGTARRLVAVATAVSRPIPGGLGIAGILSCGIFAAISGSSIVTMVAIGAVMYPALREAGYGAHFGLGSIMAGGTLGIIIPPSIPLIIYGLVTETSIVDLFVGGVGPGLLLMSLMVGYTIWVNRDRPTQRLDPIEMRQVLREGVWALLMPVVLLGGIYSGYFSVTESAGVALFYALLVEFLVHREMTLSKLYDVIIDAAKLGGALFPLLSVALSLNLVLTEHRVPETMVQLMQDWFSSPVTFMLAVNALLLLVGAFMTTGEAILILAPLLAPAAAAFGFDKVLFGIIMIVNLEIGLLTPPVGLNIIVAMSTFKCAFVEAVRAAIPFIVLMLLGLALLATFPAITMSLVR